MKISMTGGATLTINGMVYQGTSISVTNDGRVIVDGRASGAPLAGPISLVVNGDAGDVEAGSGSVAVTGRAQSVQTVSGDVKCGDVGFGVKTVSGDVHCGAVAGDISTISGDVNHMGRRKD